MYTPTQVHTGHECKSIADMLCFRPLPEVEEMYVHINCLTLKLVLDEWIKSDLIPRHLREGAYQKSPTFIIGHTILAKETYKTLFRVQF